MSISHYFEFVNVALSASISRFIVLFIDKNDFKTAGSYYSTSILFLIIVSIIMLVPAIIGSIILPNILSVPAGYEIEFGILLFIILISVFITTCTSPFMVTAFTCHRFDLQNLTKILGKVVHILVIVFAFRFLSKNITYVGVAYLISAILILITNYLITKHLLPKLSFSFSAFDKSKIKDVTSMGLWMVIAYIGAIFYLNIDLLVINVFLGSKECGRYSPVVLWLTFINLFSGSISSVFAPIAIQYIASGENDLLLIQTKRTLKLLGLITAFPVGILCGLSEPLLVRWLGEDFAGLHKLMWLMVAPAMVNSVMAPLHGISRGLNKVKVPAIATLFGGFLNLFLSIVLVKYTQLGIYGVAAATVVCRVSKNLFFMPVYIALQLKKNMGSLIPPFVPGFIFFIFISALCHYGTKIFNLANIPGLIICGGISACIFGPICYFFALSNQDRKLILSLLYSRKN